MWTPSRMHQAAAGVNGCEPPLRPLVNQIMPGYQEGRVAFRRRLRVPRPAQPPRGARRNENLFDIREMAREGTSIPTIIARDGPPGGVGEPTHDRSAGVVRQPRRGWC